MVAECNNVMVNDDDDGDVRLAVIDYIIEDDDDEDSGV